MQIEYEVRRMLSSVFHVAVAQLFLAPFSFSDSECDWPGFLHSTSKPARPEPQPRSGDTSNAAVSRSIPCGDPVNHISLIQAMEMRPVQMLNILMTATTSGNPRMGTALPA